MRPGKGVGTPQEVDMTSAGLEVDWNLVRTFVSVMEAGSLAGASRQLGFAHPTVARHIQQLESQLGLPLFERSAGGLKANDAGERLAVVAARMRKDAMTFESVTAAVKTTSTGKVRITIAELLVDLVPELLIGLKDFSGNNERQIELVISSRQLNLLEGEADIAIRHIRPSQSELVCRRVGGLPMAAYASAEYLQDHGEPFIENLDQHWFVDGVTDQPFSMAVARLGHSIPQSRVAFRTDSLRAQLRAAQAGWGIAGLPVYVGEDAGLQRVLADAPAHVTEIWVAARPGVRQQMLLGLVFQHLAEALYNRFASQPRRVESAGGLKSAASA
jgi:DNA-binding transcriptional LysR family regulator